MTEWRDFRPKQSLLNSKFDGYRLSLDPLAQYSLKFEANISVQKDLELNDHQYTYNGIKAFKSNNHLYTNPWNETELYFIDQTHAIRRVTISSDTSLSHLVQPTIVYQLSRDCLHGSLVFISDSIVLVSDGRTKLFVLNANAHSKWALLHEENLEEFSSLPIRLLHGISDEVNLHGLIGFIEQKKADSSAETQCQLIWLTFSISSDKQEIQLTRRRVLQGKKWPDFVVIDPSAQALLLATEGSYKFTFDSVIPIKPEETVKTPVLEKIESSLRYIWSQTHGTIEITIATLTTEKRQWNVTIESDHLKCSLDDEILIDATLFDSVDTNDSTFSTVSDTRNELTIVLQKAKTNSFWNEVFKDGRAIEGDVKMLDMPETKTTDDDEIKQPYNSQQLEECDQYINENDSFLFRFHGDTHQITHQALIYNQILFTKMHPPSLCLRHDVDGLVWEMNSNDQAPWTHEATLNAFGYVQASKQNRKFISAPANFSYVLIADLNTHLYLYKQRSAASSLPGTSLRNRKTGQLVESIAKQYMISLENRDEILGLVTTNERILILTEHQLFIVTIE